MHKIFIKARSFENRVVKEDIATVYILKLNNKTNGNDKNLNKLRLQHVRNFRLILFVTLLSLRFAACGTCPIDWVT